MNPSWPLPPETVAVESSQPSPVKPLVPLPSAIVAVGTHTW